jgi:hypothetical protein
MTVDLDKQDLVTLVCGSSPSYKMMSEYSVELADIGDYSGSYDRWNWNRSALDKLSEKKLYHLYILLKEYL